MTKDENKTKEHFNSRLVTSFKMFSQVASIFVAVVGGMVIIGWVFDVSILKSIHPRLVAMKANTALCFVLIGISLWLLRGESPQYAVLKRKRQAAQVCAMVVSLIGVLTLIEYMFGINLGLDQLLFKESPGAIGTSHLGRMAPNTALNFLLIGLALFFLNVETKRGLMPAQLLILPVGVISLMALVGYLYGVPTFYGLLPACTRMALHTGVLFNAVFLGVLFARPDCGFMALVVSESLGGHMLRRLIPTSGGLLLVVGGLRVAGERAGLYHSFFGTSIYTTVSMVLFILVLWLTSHSLHQLDTKRRQAEDQVKKQRSILERINKGLREAIISETAEEVARKCLALGEELTASKFGFIDILNEAGRLDAIALSDPGWAACRMPKTEAVLLTKNLEVRGILASVIREGRSVIINNPDSHPDRVGTPEGHPPITCFLGVPIKHNEKIIGIIGLANKESGYDSDDQEIVETLSRAFGQALIRKQSEEIINRLNEELKRRNLELEVINKELEAFSYSVSHDLRAPLRGMDGFSRALLEDCGDKLDAQSKDYLKRVRSASQHMGELIEGMLNLSRVTRAPLGQQAIDLSATARSIANELRQRQPQRQVEFVIAEGVMGNGDPRLLEIVLENLLSNAWKFTEKHPRAKIEFGVTERDGETLYFVRDDGAGFDMTYVDKLFGAFQRLHTEDEFGGTGIGLATVQRILHRHGGRVWAEGGIEKGATFYFTLPKVDEPVAVETINKGERNEEELCLIGGRQSR